VKSRAIYSAAWQILSGAGIHSVKHDGIPKCRVDLGDIVTTWLPLCQFCRGEPGGFNPYAVGDAVTVLSEAGA
jgi:phage baseplate assembly protein gpV